MQHFQVEMRDPYTVQCHTPTTAVAIIHHTQLIPIIPNILKIMTCYMKCVRHVRSTANNPKIIKAMGQCSTHARKSSCTHTSVCFEHMTKHARLELLLIQDNIMWCASLICPLI